MKLNLAARELETVERAQDRAIGTWAPERSCEPGDLIDVVGHDGERRTFRIVRGMRHLENVDNASIVRERCRRSGARVGDRIIQPVFVIEMPDLTGAWTEPDQGFLSRTVIMERMA